ncbi:hypothetical protein AMTR_s00005p00268630 [Amborella trichopoda]|uniref:Uncharacterized protein n=1 Tax=Amborella trichopoda TaxID=13333 RepID=W1PH61_AMBTC|nr:hypothetical protein AMTR_s00005p00268630 [Amborella trichopoda]
MSRNSRPSCWRFLTWRRRIYSSTLWMACSHGLSKSYNNTGAGPRIGHGYASNRWNSRGTTHLSNKPLSVAKEKVGEIERGPPPTKRVLTSLQARKMAKVTKKTRHDQSP